MSIQLPTIDLSNATIGAKFTVDLSGVALPGHPSQGGQGTVLLFNESGAGLQCSFIGGGGGFFLPAGAWTPIPVPPGASQINCTVTYLMPNSQVAVLAATYYNPNEAVPQTMTLGNSPIAGGNVSSSVNTLSNEGNPTNTLVIDIGDLTLAQLWKIYTDHFAISVDQGGTAHTVLQGNTSGNPLKVGQAGDTTEILGQLLIDQLVTAIAGMVINQITGPSSGNLNITAGSSGLIFLQDAPASNQLEISSAGITLKNGSLNLLAGQFNRMNSHRTTCGSGTVINHGLGTTPTASVGCPDIAQPGSATVGTGSNNSTSFTATVGAGSSIGWIAGAGF